MKKMWQGALKSKTIWFSIFIAIGGVLQSSTDFLSSVMNQKTMGYFMLIVGFITAILRVVTTQSLGDKSDD